MKRREKYTGEFREEAVKNQSYPLKKPQHQLQGIQGLRSLLLRKKLKNAELERDILKKAAAYFASQGQ